MIKYNSNVFISHKWTDHIVLNTSPSRKNIKQIRYHLEVEVFVVVFLGSTLSFPQIPVRDLCLAPGDYGISGKGLWQPELQECFLVRTFPSFSQMVNNLPTGKWWWRPWEGSQKSQCRWKFQMPLLKEFTFFASLPAGSDSLPQVACDRMR